MKRDEPIRDPELRAALERLEGRSGLSEAEAERLARRISFAALGPLARLRRGRARWWEVTARWWRAAIPSAAAAALAIALLAPFSDESAPEENLSVRSGLAAVVAGELAEGDVIDAIVGPAGGDWLLTTAVESEVEP